MRRRVLCLLLAAVMTVALAACGEPSATEAPSEAPTVAPTAASDPATPDAADTIDLRAFIKGFDRSGSVEEQTVCDAEGVTVTVKNIRYDSIAGAVLCFVVRNASDKDIFVQADAAAVNDSMIPVDFSIRTNAGKSAEGEMTFPYAALALADVHVIAAVEFSLRLTDASSYEVIAVCAPAVVRTSAAEGYKPTVDDEGQTVYDEKDIRIVLKGIDDSRLFSESIAMAVYLYNGTDRDVCIQTGEIHVNGYDMTSAMTVHLMPGKHAVDLVEFFDMDLEEYAIDEIDSVELSFKIVDEQSWKVIAQTELIPVELG